MNNDPQLSETWLEIHSEIEALRQKAKAAAILQIRLLMTQYGILPSDLRGVGSVSPCRNSKPEYWNPQTGQTWTGRGRMPKWLVGKDPESYRIAR
ncbi:H-NS family nucleoid-associated regulatory protein [Burkholderia sp. NLJ2]|uniref:H-NS histone family protein n=1 Tax=Burkholderia sp. NLJ2 TaxID=3090699 RepID=UPI003C6C88EE